MEKKVTYQRCSEGLWDTSIPNIKFDENGLSNYYKMFKKLDSEFSKGKEGSLRWNNILKNIKKNKKSKYDCIIGISGGTDSCYLLHLAVKKWNLRPLAVNLDNGWSTDIALSNIKKITSDLDVDLETYVINYEEVKAVLVSFMKAGLPWIDGPTDLAIKAILYKIASAEKIKTILVGTDFRSEGKQPEEWTHSDSKLFNYVIKKYSDVKLKTYPKMSIFKQIYYGGFLKIRKYQPFYLLDYNKQEAQQILIKNYDWKYYGGHHHENLFTKFAISYWMYEKFNIDKRIITLSAQVLSKQIQRNAALDKIKNIPYDINQIKIDNNIVLKKLGISNEEFEIIWNSANKSFKDYPSYYDFFIKNKKIISYFYKFFMPFKPKMIVVEDE